MYNASFFLADEYSLNDLPAPRVLVRSEHRGSREPAASVDEDVMMQRYAVDHMMQSFSSNPDAVYCMPLHPGCMHQLVDLLSVQDLVYEGDDLDLQDFTPNLEALGLPVHLKNVLFFRIASVALGNASIAAAKRRKLRGEMGLLRTDVSISVHRVTGVNLADRIVMVTMSPANQWAEVEKQPLVLSLHAVPLDVLRQTIRWTPTGKIFLQLETASMTEKLADVDISDEGRQRLVDMMHVLYGAGRDGHRPGFLKKDDWTHEREDDALAVLADAGLVEQHGERWHLTIDGQNIGVAVQHIKTDAKALKCRSIELDEQSIYELLMHLLHEGWEHCKVARATRALCPPYKHGGPKKLFSRRADVSVGHFYLLALATSSQRPDVEHAHFKSEGYYQCLIEGKPFTRKKRVQIVAPHELFNEDDWPEDSFFEPPPPRPRGRRAPGAAVAAEAALEDEAGDVEEAADDDPDSDHDSSSSAGPSSSSTSSSSSSSDEDGGDGGGGGGGGPGVPAEEEEAAGVLPAADVPMEAGDSWGPFRLTPYRSAADGHVTSIQLTCRHPLHIAGGLLCTKQRTIAGKGEAFVRRQLKYWAIKGIDVLTKLDHHLLWLHEVKNISEADLPSEAALDAHLPIVWPE